MLQFSISNNWERPRLISRCELSSTYITKLGVVKGMVHGMLYDGDGSINVYALRRATQPLGEHMLRINIDARRRPLPAVTR
jgi:hypothetical protein